MKLLADECVDARLAAHLRVVGHDVRFAVEDARGEPDEVVLARAYREGRLLLTEDTDFGELVVRLGLPVRGVLLLRLSGLGPAAQAERLLNLLTQQSARLMDAFVVLEPGRTRIRPLPSES